MGEENFCNGTKILDVKMIIPKNKPNGFRYTRSDDLHSLNFTFDYIDKNQGAVFQLLHTGTSIEDVKLTGNIIGFGNPKIIDNSLILEKQDLPIPLLKVTDNYKYLKIISLFYYLSASIIAMILGISIFLYRNALNTNPKDFVQGVLQGLMGSYYEIYAQINYYICLGLGSVFIIIGILEIIFVLYSIVYSIVDPLPEEFDIQGSEE